MVQPPINFKKWIDDNRDKLKPPVGNQTIYKDKDFIIMVVGGPNARKDYHHNRGEEFFYQIEGDINVRVMENGKPKDIPLKAGEIFLLPANLPHSPQRPAGSIGLVIERQRNPEELDGFQWYCEKCNTKLYEEYIPLKSIVDDLPKVFDRFWSDKANTTCPECGAVMEKPAPAKAK
jgi:3-hydroxyanthranilate 3,4-dioxygenase